MEKINKNDYYIYKITNLVNGKVYIGQTLNPSKRFKKHIYSLKNNSHYNIYLQNSWNKYGIDNFEFKIINSANKLNDANLLEIQYIKLYHSTNPTYGYNIESGGKNSSPSEKTKTKISKTMIKNETTKGTNNGMYGIKGKLNPNYGKKLTTEHKQKLSKAKKGKRISEKHKNVLRNILLNNGIFNTDGVTLDKRKNFEKRCWKARIRYNNHRTSLGLFEDPFSAELVYKLVKREIH